MVRPVGPVLLLVLDTIVNAIIVSNLIGGSYIVTKISSRNIDNATGNIDIIASEIRMLPIIRGGNNDATIV